MPRRPRSDLTGFPLHLIQRGNNRLACFFSANDHVAYLHWLDRYARRLGVALHAWVLMSNHVHLLLTPPSPAQASRLMQALGRRYVRYVNHTYRRSGTLWEGRFRACAVHAEDYLLSCMRYIELNPVRAGMVADPGDYRWSSYRQNGLGLADTMLTEHPLYTDLGETSPSRQAFAPSWKNPLSPAYASPPRPGTCLPGNGSGRRSRQRAACCWGPRRAGVPGRAVAGWTGSRST